MTGAVSWPADRVERWPLARLIPYARNARTHTPDQVKQIAASMREWGWTIPVLADEKGGIIAGHARVMAAALNQYTEAPVMIACGWSDAKKRAYVLADNKLALNAGWDDSILSAELTDLKALAYDLPLTGFSYAEIGDLLNPSGDPTADACPDVPEHATTVAGDLWLLGNHRLLCGDSTSIDSVLRLMNGEKAGLVNTDPPYGVSYANEDRPNPGVAKPRVANPRVANDEFKDEALQTFLESCFRNAVLVLKPDAAWYLWHAHLTQGFFAAAAAAAAAQVILHRQIIWVKEVLLLGRGQYHWKHEPCFMGWVRGNEPPDYGRGHGERDQTTVWNIASITQAERKEFNHSTPKPVALFEIPMIKHLRSGEICFEPFAGSGPQIIAAEKQGCSCFAMELEPKYCDVIVTRWQTYTGKKATRECDGRLFDEVAEQMEVT
jgi:DNA modification methylase